MARISSRNRVLLLTSAVLAAVLSMAAAQREPVPAAQGRPSATATGLDIVLRPTAGLENNAEAKAAFLRAAAQWEFLIQNPITVIIDADFGPTRFGAPAAENHDGTMIVEAPQGSWPYDQFRAGLLGVFPNSPVFNALPLNSVPTDIGPIGTVCATQAVADVLGLDGQFGAAPSIAFNSAIPFDFDPSDGVGVDKIDFEGLALHGIGHVLGFTSQVGEQDLHPSDPRCLAPLDVLRGDEVWTYGDLDTAVRTLFADEVVGRDQRLFLAELEQPLLSSARADGTGGDGRPAAHWKDDQLNRIYYGIMYPAARYGKVLYPTYNDLLAHNRMGYSFTKPAAPPRMTGINAKTFNPSSKTPSFFVNGERFVQGSVVKFKGQNRGTIQNSPTELQVFLTPEDVATKGLGQVTVFNPTSIDSNPLFLNIPEGTGPCGGGTALCLRDRYRVEVAWATANRSGIASSVKLTSDTGYFWFFDPKNVEIVLKVLQGNNDHQWVFYGSLTSVRWSMKILDTQTGEIVNKFNPFGNLGSGADTLAFPTPEATPEEAAIARASLRDARTPELLYADLVTANPIEPAGAAPACTPGATTLCLNGGRFEVEVDWRVPSQDREGVGTAIPITDDTGYFWFFNSANVELVIKVLDAPQPGKFWVFYGALSTVEYTITVTDKQTNTARTYFNPSGTQASKADTSAF